MFALIFSLFICKYRKYFVPLQAEMKIVIVIALVGAGMLLLSVGVILRKDGKFRSEHIAENKRMRQEGIHCATSQDREARRTNHNQIDIKQL